MLGESFGNALALVDLVLIVAVSVLAGVAYHLYAYGEPGIIVNYIRFGGLVSLFYLLPRSIRGQYDITEIAGRSPGFRQSFFGWNFAFLCVLTIALLGKLTGDYSRGAVVLTYLLGFAGLSLTRAFAIGLLYRGLDRGVVAIRRVMLVGTQEKISAFLEGYGQRRSGLKIAGIEILPASTTGAGNNRPGKGELRQALKEAVSRARTARPDDIILLVSWSDERTINECTDALMTLPAAIHLGPVAIFERFDNVHLSRVGTATGLKLVRSPLALAELCAKRTLDLVAATSGLIVLSPLLALIALAIKLDLPGPVLFLQHRHGFNQEPFRIFKFRTMTTNDDGPVVPQATANDPRVTRVGRFLRRWNLDELPQLWNVVRGNMSIVGPRPHAMVHNHDFEARIALYARRHNVKPGITGWAQINGLRGETDTDEKMRARVEHDLHYIDNWSIWFDIYIMAMTVLSPRAFRNAL